MSEAAVAQRFPACAPGWSLPAAYYTDAEVFGAELDTVFRRCWLFAGHSCEIAAPGDYLVFSLGADSIIVVRDEHGTLRAHHNVCRHRGSRLCAEPSGSARAFVCPYHQWVYGLDGRLRSARLMGADFDVHGYSLAAAGVREVAGLIFVRPGDEHDDDGEDFAAAEAALRAQLGPHRLDRARIVHRAHYRVAANWKTLVENNRECYHCRANHPEFLESNFEFGTHGDPRRSEQYDELLAEAQRQWRDDGLAADDVNFPSGGSHRVARLPLRRGYRTETLDGELAAPTMGDVRGNPGSLRVILLPTLWAHANIDYAVTTRLTPIDAGTTDVDVCFLVDGNAADEDVDIAALTAVWTATSEQDWQLCEANYAGVRSPAYRPGPLSDIVENSVAHFLQWYLDRLGR